MLSRHSGSLFKHLNQAQQIQELRLYHIFCSQRLITMENGDTFLHIYVLICQQFLAWHGWEVNYVTSCPCLYANCCSCASRAGSHVHYSTPGQNRVQKSRHFSHKSPNLTSPVSINATHWLTKTEQGLPFFFFLIHFTKFVCSLKGHWILPK